MWWWHDVLLLRKRLSDARIRFILWFLTKSLFRYVTQWYAIRKRRQKLRIARLALKMESACARLDTPEKHPALVQQKKKHLIVQGQLVAKFLALTSHIAHEPWRINIMYRGVVVVDHLEKDAVPSALFNLF